MWFSSDLLELRLFIDSPRVGERLWHGLLAKFLCPNVVLERLIGSIIRDHLILVQI